MSDGTVRMSSPASCASPFAADQPMRSPVKLPGPSPTTMPSRSRGRRLSRSSTKSTNRMISAACRRAPCTCAPLSATGGRPAATLAMSVAVSMASQCPPITALPHPLQFRTPHSAFHTPEGSRVASPDLFQLSGVGIRTVAQAVVPIQRWCPRSRAFGPFDQEDRAVAHHVVEREVAGFVGRLEPVAVHVVDRPAVGGYVVMHEGVGGTGGQYASAEARADRLDQSRLPRPELAGEPDHHGAREVAPERVTEPLELVRGQAHDARCRLRPGARGSGRAAPP